MASQEIEVLSEQLAAVGFPARLVAEAARKMEHDEFDAGGPQFSFAGTSAVPWSTLMQ